MLNLPHSQRSKYNILLILHVFFWSEYKKQSDLIGDLITYEQRAMKLSNTKGPFFKLKITGEPLYIYSLLKMIL